MKTLKGKTTSTFSKSIGTRYLVPQNGAIQLRYSDGAEYRRLPNGQLIRTNKTFGRNAKGRRKQRLELRKQFEDI